MKAKKTDRGYATVELTLIMPLLVILIILITGLFIDTVNDAALRAESYEYLYTYNRYSAESPKEKGELSFSHTLMGHAGTGAEVFTAGGEVAVSAFHMERKVDGGYATGSSAEYRTEYDKTTERLRRWQLYGDYLWE